MKLRNGIFQCRVHGASVVGRGRCHVHSSALADVNCAGRCEVLPLWLRKPPGLCLGELPHERVGALLSLFGQVRLPVRLRASFAQLAFETSNTLIGVFEALFNVFYCPYTRRLLGDLVQERSVRGSGVLPEHLALCFVAIMFDCLRFFVRGGALRLERAGVREHHAGPQDARGFDGERQAPLAIGELRPALPGARFDC